MVGCYLPVDCSTASPVYYITIDEWMHNECLGKVAELWNSVQIVCLRRHNWITGGGGGKMGKVAVTYLLGLTTT
jgi:hypothetical protein